jgi:hypothetical protein
MADMKKKLKFKNGTDYLTKDGWKRAEVGDVRDDVLPTTAKWLLEYDLAEEVKEDKAAGKAKAAGGDA